VKLHIHPTWHPEYVLLTEEPDIIGHPVMEPIKRSRDIVFGALDLMRHMYDDIIVHRDTI
jgi:hypothetical protein